MGPAGGPEATSPRPPKSSLSTGRRQTALIAARPWMSVPLALALALASTATFPRVSLADEPTDKVHHDRAQAAYREALELYKSGRYRDAVQRLEEARSFDPAAKELPYNLGLVHEKLGEIDDAIKYFKMYIGMEADQAERDRVQAIIKRLEGARDAFAAKADASASSSAPPPPPPAPPSKKGRLDRWTYVAGGATIVFAGVGAAFGVSALSTRPSDPTTAPGGKSIADLVNDAHDAHARAVDADVFFGLAVAAATGTALLYFLRDQKTESTVQGFVVPQRGGAAGTLGVAF